MRMFPMNTDGIRRGMFSMNTDRIRHAVAMPACVVLLLAVLATVVALPARAGQAGVRADRPKVWPGATVNAIVLPYQYTGRNNKPLSKTAKELTLLTHMNVLFSMLKYGGVGATTLTTRGMDAVEIRREFSANVVMDKILGRRSGAESEIRSRMGVVMLWGYVYEEGDDIYVQSYVRFLRRDILDRIKLEIRGPDGLMELVGRLPDQAFAFAPRRLTKKDISDIRNAFATTARLYTDANESSTSHEVILDPDVRFSYRVTDTRSGWMHIESFRGDVGGWVKAEPSLGQKTLNHKLPELDFVEAVVGYMRYRIATDGTAAYSNPGRLVGWVDNALDRYERYSGKNRAAAPAATAMILRGNLKILSAGRDRMPGAVRSAGRKYTDAVELIPYNADARNLEAMAWIFMGHRNNWSKKSPNDISRALQGAVALDPNNGAVLSNLETFYTLIEALPESITKIARERLNRKLAAVKRVRANL